MNADEVYDKLYELTEDRPLDVPVVFDKNKCFAIEDIVYDEEIEAVVIVPRDKLS